MAELLRRLRDALPESFETRDEAATELGRLFEAHPRRLLDQDAILDASTATDGVAIETVQAADERSFVVEGRLWRLDGRNSWAVPYRATITPAEGVDAVESYRITVGQPLAPRTDHAGRQTPVDAYEWLVVDDNGPA